MSTLALVAKKWWSLISWGGGESGEQQSAGARNQGGRLWPMLGTFTGQYRSRGEECPASGCKEAMRPQGLRTIYLFVGLGGRDNGCNHKDKDFASLGDSQPCQCPLPRPSQGVLRCPTATAFSLQAADTRLASPPCSHPGVSTHALVSVQPHTLFLETQRHAQIFYSLWRTSLTTALALE